MSRPAPYSANHNRVRKVRGNAALLACQDNCGRPAKDWALIHGRDGSDPDDYMPLCRSCHWHYDEDGQRRGIERRSADPEWQRKRGLLRRDSAGRYA